MPSDAFAQLTPEGIAERLRRPPPDPELDMLAKANPQLRRAAVLVPMLQVEGQWRLLLTRRAETLNSHKGQVAFPGGAVDAEDASAVDTALREAHEEIGLEPRDARVLGTLQERPTISRFMVTPVVALAPWPYPYRLSSAEVSRLFSVPLEWLAVTGNYEYRPRSSPDGFYERVLHYQLYDGEILWGASARITLDLLRTLGLLEPGA